MELQCRNNETSHYCQGIPLKRSLKPQQHLTHVNSFLYKPQNGPIGFQQHHSKTTKPKNGTQNTKYTRNKHKIFLSRSS